jgi:hypothetical protein
MSVYNEERDRKALSQQEMVSACAEPLESDFVIALRTDSLLPVLFS